MNVNSKKIDKVTSIYRKFWLLCHNEAIYRASRMLINNIIEWFENILFR